MKITSLAWVMAILLMAILFLGCTSNQDTPQQIIEQAKLMPEVAKILVENPNSTFSADLIDSSVMAANINEFKTKCPNSTLNIAPYWRVIIFSGQKTTTLLLSTPQKELVCQFTETTAQAECIADKECDDKISCTIDTCEGTPKKCIHIPITTCANNDSCCPTNCNEQNDSDCIKNECAKSVDCDDSNQSTKDECTGTPKKCIHTEITTCTNSDGVCPANCTNLNDNDCQPKDECNGNGDCDDKNPLTNNFCQGTPKKCVFELRTCAEALGQNCASNQACDQPAVKTKDNQNCCLGKCKNLDECVSNSECDDKNPCTTDNCNGFPKKCNHTAITTCTNNDSCCPTTCSYTNDSDCSKPTCSPISDQLCPTNCHMEDDIDCCIKYKDYCWLQEYSTGPYFCTPSGSRSTYSLNMECVPSISQTSWSPARPVLKIVDLSFNPFEPKPNENVELQIVIKNEGPGDLISGNPQMQVTYITNNSERYYTLNVPVPISANEKKTITYSPIQFSQEGFVEVNARLSWTQAEGTVNSTESDYVEVRSTPRQSPCTIQQVCIDSTHTGNQSSDCARTGYTECSNGCETWYGGYGVCRLPG